MPVVRSDAPFYWPLRGNLALQNGSGTPTFTRATAAWGFNETGKLYKVPSGAVRMRGYRPVINMLASPEALATQGIATEARTYTISFYGTGTIAFSGSYAGANLAGTGASNRVQRTFTATAGTLTLTVTGSCTQAQMEDVTGKTDQTASEYVNSAVDVIKYFATYKDGTPIPEANLLGARLNPNAITNNLLYCRDLLAGALAGKWIPSTTGSNLVTNGTFDTDASGWTTFNCSLSVASGQCTMTASGDNPYMSQSMSTVVGKLYVVACDIVSDSMSGNNFVKVGSTSGSGSIGGLVTTVGTNKFCFIATGTITYITVSGVTGVSGQTIVVDNISCYEAGIQVALNQTGIDGLTNGATLLTAGTSNPTILQTITAAASAGCSGFYVKRSAGTGSIYFTRDGGSNWTDITSSINSTDFTLVKIENTSVTNPQVGFKIATNGDAIIVDAGINHLGAQISETPVITTSAAVTVNADVPTAPTSGNFSDTAGTILATVTRDDWTAGNGSAVGSATRGLYTSSANSGAQGLDGTNTVNGPSGTPSGIMRIGIRWSGSTMQAFSNGTFGPAGSYDGSFNLGAAMQLLAGVQGSIKDVAIWPSSLSDDDMISASKGMTFDGVLASLSMSAPDGVMTIGRTISSAAASLALTAPDSQITIGRTIESDPASLSLIAPDGLMTIGRIIEADAATLTSIAPDGRVLLDDSPKSTVTIIARI